MYLWIIYSIKYIIYLIKSTNWLSTYKSEHLLLVYFIKWTLWEQRQLLYVSWELIIITQIKLKKKKAIWRKKFKSNNRKSLKKKLITNIKNAFLIMDIKSAPFGIFSINFLEQHLLWRIYTSFSINKHTLIFLTGGILYWADI